MATLNDPAMATQGFLRLALGICLSLREKYSPFPDYGPLTHGLFALGLLYYLAQLAHVVYRLSPIHPLAKFPGPRLAKATGWYRTYHEVFKKGNMLEELRGLHSVYGPVVRIGPNDLHFITATAYTSIYSTKSKATKDPWLYACFNEDQSSFGFTDPHLAKARRECIAPFFARRNILDLQRVIVQKVDCLCDRLSKMKSTTLGAQFPVVDLGSAARSLTADIIMSFCFGESGCLNALEDRNFRHPVTQSMEEGVPMLWVFKHFPIVRKMVVGTPEWVSVKIGAGGSVMLKKKLNEQLFSFLDNTQSNTGKSPVPLGAMNNTIFYRLLDEKGQPITSHQSLSDEAQALYAAGSDTVGNTLSVGTYHILSNPHVHLRLQKELKMAWPSGRLGDVSADGPDIRPGWEQLEKLPYLTAVIKECLRLSHGVVSPLSRIIPTQGVIIDDMFIPPGTTVGASAPFIHHDEDIFPDPTRFNPERWLGPKSKQLEKYLVAFSRGPRSCIGMNLAWCELYLSFAMLFRKFDLELYQTTKKDIRYQEFFIPLVCGRIRTTIRRAED